MPKTDMFNGMGYAHLEKPRGKIIVKPGWAVEILASGAWHFAQVDDYGMDPKCGYWFSSKAFTPRFWMADEGITWRHWHPVKS